MRLVHRACVNSCLFLSSHRGDVANEKSYGVMNAIGISVSERGASEHHSRSVEPKIENFRLGSIDGNDTQRVSHDNKAGCVHAHKWRSARSCLPEEIP